MNTGKIVQNTPFTSDSPYTWTGWISKAAGRSTKNWAMQATLETHIAYDTSRSDPIRRTSSPEPSR